MRLNFRLTLLELFGLMTLVAMMIPSMLYANTPLLHILGSLSFAVVFSVAIIALTSKRPSQRFCLGFAVALVLFQSSYAVYGLNKMLPAESLLSGIYQIAPHWESNSEEWYDADGQDGFDWDDGEDAPDWNSPGDDIVHTYPRRSVFIAMGRMWVGIVVGIMGGFAVRSVLPAPPEEAN
jgi:hypothetical protein